MQWAFEEFGNEVYTSLSTHTKAIKEYCEKQDLNLKSKQINALCNPSLWQKHLELLNTARRLMEAIGAEEHNDFNLFREKVEKELKSMKVKLGASEKNAILNAITWYDESAEKVKKSIVKLSGEKLEQALTHLRCSKADLSDFGFYPTGKKGEFQTYETESNLRDTENVPLKESIHSYFLQEVKPHVDEAWVNLDATKIGYEISFNKYFYRHKPLRSLEEVTADILSLESESDGLIREILNLA